MIKLIKKLFAKKPTKEQEQAAYYNALAGITLASIAWNAGKKK